MQQRPLSCTTTATNRHHHSSPIVYYHHITITVTGTSKVVVVVVVVAVMVQFYLSSILCRAGRLPGPTLNTLISLDSIESAQFKSATSSWLAT